MHHSLTILHRKREFVFVVLGDIVVARTHPAVVACLRSAREISRIMELFQQQNPALLSTPCLLPFAIHTACAVLCACVPLYGAGGLAAWIDIALEMLSRCVPIPHERIGELRGWRIEPARMRMEWIRPPSLTPSGL